MRGMTATIDKKTPEIELKLILMVKKSWYDCHRFANLLGASQNDT
jgi:hypothetical protein